MIQALLREREFEFALTLATELEEAIATLPPDYARQVPVDIRSQVQSLRLAAQAGIQDSV